MTTAGSSARAAATRSWRRRWPPTWASPRHVCDACEESFHAPLAGRPRLIWWSTAMVGLALADILLMTRVVVPGLLALVVAGVGIAGLLASTRLRRGHRTRGRNIWLVHLARRTAHISETVASHGQ